MNFIITGCSGFIGFHVAKRLLDENYNVEGIDSLNKYYDINLKKSRLKILKSYKKFRFHKFNLSNQKKIKKILKAKKNFSFLHFAAQPGVRVPDNKYSKYFTDNIKVFFNILESIKLYNPKIFLFASSSSVYGNQKRIPQKEESNITHPLSFYGATKSCNEIMAYSYAHKFKIKTIALRFFSVFGPYGRPDMAYYKFSKAIINNKNFEVYNDGNSLRDFTYIKDIENAIFKILMKKKPLNKIYDVFNIGKSKPIKLNDVIKIIYKILNKKNNPKIIKKTKKIQESKITYCDNRKLFKYINFKPKYKIDIGMKIFINWLVKYNR